jgi:hypothetical protein
VGTGSALGPAIGHLAVTALLIAVAVLTTAPTEALAGLPLLLIVVALISGRYPGVETLARLAERRRRPRRAAAATGSPRASLPTLRPPALRHLAACRRLRAPPFGAPAASG